MSDFAHNTCGKVFGITGAVLAVLLSIGGPLHAGSGDPFDKANEAGAAAIAEKVNVQPARPANKAGPQLTIADVIDFDISVTPKEVRPGQTVKLTITGTPKPGYHAYPLTQRTRTRKASC